MSTAYEYQIRSKRRESDLRQVSYKVPFYVRCDALVRICAHAYPHQGNTMKQEYQLRSKHTIDYTKRINRQRRPMYSENVALRSKYFSVSLVLTI